jgi:hypothetical protein
MGKKEIVYNYFKIVDEDGEIVGVVGAEQGSPNEFDIVEKILDSGFRPVKITEKEYIEYDEGDEFKNF